MGHKIDNDTRSVKWYVHITAILFFLSITPFTIEPHTYDIYHHSQERIDAFFTDIRINSQAHDNTSFNKFMNIYLPLIKEPISSIRNMDNLFN